MNQSKGKTSTGASNRPRRSCQNTEEKIEPYKTDNLTESVSKTKRIRRSNVKNEIVNKTESPEKIENVLDIDKNKKPLTKKNDRIKDKTLKGNEINGKKTPKEKKHKKSNNKSVIIPEENATIDDNEETDNLNTCETPEVSDKRLSNADIDGGKTVNSPKSRRSVKRKARIESESTYHSSDAGDEIEEEIASESDDSSCGSKSNFKCEKRSSQSRRKSARRIIDSDETSDQSSGHESRRSNRQRKTRVQAVVESDFSDDEEMTIQETPASPEKTRTNDEVIKKRRGRPKKTLKKENDPNTVLSIAASLFADEKSKNQEELAKEEDEKKSKRKRGRPSSTKISVEFDDEEETKKQGKLAQEEDGNKTKRKRGRPSRVPIQPVDFEEDGKEDVSENSKKLVSSASLNHVIFF